MKSFFQLIVVLLFFMGTGSQAAWLDDYYRSVELPAKTVVFAGDKQPAWIDVWQEARRQVREGNLERAVERYALLLTEKTDIAQAQWELASLHLVLHQFDEAAGLLETLLEEYPRRIAYLHGLGYVMYKKGHFERAAELYGRAAQLEPEDGETLTGMSESLLTLGRDAEAVPYLEKLAALRDNEQAIRARLARVYVRLGRYEQARPLVVNIAEGEGAKIEDLVLAATVLEELDLQNLAAHFWRLVLEREPDRQKAHRWLAAFYEREGRCSEALKHLHVLEEQLPEEAELYSRIGGCYLNMNEAARALPYFEKFLQFAPDDKETIRHLVNIHASLGHERETLAALDRYFQVEQDPSPLSLRRAAKLYDAAGRYHDAIPLYRRLLELNPDDPKILDTLSEDLLSIGEDEGALKILAHLATISSERKEIYAEMAALLEKLERKAELLQVLEALHRLDPDDHEVTLRLVTNLLEAGEQERATEVFDAVADGELYSENLLEQRAGIFLRLDMAQHALQDYEEVLRLLPGRNDLHLICLQLAGSLGRLQLIERHHEALAGQAMAPETLLQVANAYRDGGDYENAHQLYGKLLADSRQDRFIRRILMEQARTYEHQGLDYEAEEALRLALVSSGNDRQVLRRLVDLNIRTRSLDVATAWLDILIDSSSGSGSAQVAVARDSADLEQHLLKLRLYNARGDFGEAYEAGQQLLRERALTAAGTPAEEDQASIRAVKRELARAALGLEQYDEAESLCRHAFAPGDPDFPALVLLQAIYRDQGDTAAAEAVFRQTLSVARRDLGRMLRLVDLYRLEDDHESMERVALAASRVESDSYIARLWLVRAYIESEKVTQAIYGIRELEKQYPSKNTLIGLSARLFFRTGRYDVALAHCETLLAREPSRADMILLKGRIYWQMLKWKESLKVYENYLSPPLSTTFREQVAAAGLDLPPEPKPTFWERLTIRTSVDLSFFERSMKPAYAARSDDEKMKKIAASFYAGYRWQKRFAREMEARLAVKRSDYLQAINHFSSLVEEYPDDESLLYDLAGIYSRLGRLGDEAFLYNRLAAIDPDYPGLQEAMERNRLKREPRLNVTYSFQEEEGWSGYKAIRRQATEVGYWTSLKPRNDIDVAVSRIWYDSTDSDRGLTADRFFAEHQVNLFDRIDVRLGGGVEDLENGHGGTGLLSWGVKGKVGDRLQGEFNFARDVVSDTIASLTRNVVAENFQGDIFVGILPRLLTGGGYGFTNYSDGNDVKGYSLWASYIIFPEPTFLQFTFTYEFQDAREMGDTESPPAPDGFAPEDHPYWSPKNYWKNCFDLLWRHKLSADTLERGTPSYYTAEYAVDYDSNGYALQTLKGGFFVEWSRHLMFESSVKFVVSDEYRTKNFELSAIYRW